MSGPSAAPARPCRATTATNRSGCSAPSARRAGPPPASCCRTSAPRRRACPHLGEIGAQVAPGARAVVVLDGAGWHRQGGRLEVPGNLSPLPLPPYAPELDGAEGLWEYLRSNRLSQGLRRPRRRPGRLLRRPERPRRIAGADPIHRRPRLGIGQCRTPLVSGVQLFAASAQASRRQMSRRNAALRTSAADRDPAKVPRAVLDRLTDLACYAA